MTAEFDDARARSLLEKLAVPACLREHLTFVADAAADLVAAVAEMGIPVDATAVVAGARLHDIGKLVVPMELSERVTSRESAGLELLRAHHVPEVIARAAWVHGDWSSRAETLEDLLVCLAEELSRGTRDQELERASVRTIAVRSGLDGLDVYPWFLAACDDIASGAADRLADHPCSD